MAASKEENARYRRSLRNPFEGAVGRQLNPTGDSRVVVDIPRRAETIKRGLADVFNFQKNMVQRAGDVLVPGRALVNALGPASSAALDMLDDPSVHQAFGFGLDRPAITAQKGNPYRVPNFGDSKGISASATFGQPQPTATPNVALAAPFSGGPVGLDQFRAAIVQQESRGNYAARNRDTGAMGAYQVMPETGRVLAERLGLPWRPDLMTSNTPEGRQYQDAVGNAAVKEAYEYGGGDMAKAAMYYHGGSNTKIWGPKTRQYAAEVGQRLGGAGGLMNPFDSGAPYMDQALGAVRAGTQAALQPFTVNAKMPDAPEFPDAPQLPKRDFSESTLR